MYNMHPVHVRCNLYVFLKLYVEVLLYKLCLVYNQQSLTDSIISQFYFDKFYVVFRLFLFCTNASVFVKQMVRLV